MKSISELLDEVSRTKEALKKAQDAFDTAKKALAESPLLEEVGLQVIGEQPRKKRVVSEETKQKQKDAWARRKAEKAKK